MLFQEFQLQYKEKLRKTLNLLDPTSTINEAPYYYEKGNNITIFQFMTSLTDVEQCSKALNAFQTYFLSSPIPPSIIEGIDRLIIKNLQQCSLEVLPFLLRNLHRIFPLNLATISNISMSSLMRERGMIYAYPGMLKDPLSFIRSFSSFSSFTADDTSSLIDYLLSVSEDHLGSFFENLNLPIHSNSENLILLSLKISPTFLLTHHCKDTFPIFSIMAFNHLLYSSDLSPKKSILSFLSKNPPPPLTLTFAYSATNYNMNTISQYKLLFNLSHHLYLKDSSFIPKFLLQSPHLISINILSPNASEAAFAMKILQTHCSNDISMQTIKLLLDYLDVLYLNRTLEDYFSFLLIRRNEKVLLNELVILTKKMILNDSTHAIPCILAFIKHSTPVISLQLLSLIYNPSLSLQDSSLISQISHHLLPLIDELEETPFFKEILLPYIEEMIILPIKGNQYHQDNNNNYLWSSNQEKDATVSIAIREETPSILLLFISMVTNKKDIYNLILAPFIKCLNLDHLPYIMEEVHSIIINSFIEEVEDEDDLILLLNRLSPYKEDDVNGAEDVLVIADTATSTATATASTAPTADHQHNHQNHQHNHHQPLLTTNILNNLLPLIEDDSYNNSMNLKINKKSKTKLPTKVAQNILKKILPMMDKVKNSLNEDIIIRILQVQHCDDFFDENERKIIGNISSKKNIKILFEISRLLRENDLTLFAEVREYCIKKEVEVEVDEASSIIYENTLLLPHNQNDYVWNEYIIPLHQKYPNKKDFIVQYLMSSPPSKVIERLSNLRDGYLSIVNEVKIITAKIVPFSMEDLRESIEKFASLTSSAKKEEEEGNIILIIANSIPFLENFSSRRDDWGISLMSNHLSLGNGRLIVMEIIRQLQSSTRSLQCMCNHLKICRKRKGGRSSMIPRMKKVLEKTIYCVKGMLEDVGRGESFWIGNLRNRGLDGGVLEDEMIY